MITRSEEKETEQPERPKTSMGHGRKESREASKSPERTDTPRSASEDRKPNGSQSSFRKSPASSRKSSAKSQRSLKLNTTSESSGRASSKVSLRSSETSKGDVSETKGDDSAVKEFSGDERFQHKEGKDRPKSRLGHPGGADDRDKGENDD